MVSLAPVPAETFEAILHVDIDRLSTLPENSLRAILPCLVRMSLCHPLDSSEKWTKDRKKILKCLSGIEVVNSLVGLLSIDFHALEQDAKKEQQLRAKMGGHHTESVLISQLEQSLALEFERSDAARKLRLLLSELLFIMSQIKENKKGKFYTKSSELFESEVYLEEVSDVLCIAQAELPHLLPVADVAEALLHVRNGAWLLSRLVANVAHTFHQVCVSLLTSDIQAEEEGIGGQRRSEALRMLCTMCPSQALTIRRLCVEHHKLPSLAVSLTLSCDGRPIDSDKAEPLSSGHHQSGDKLGEVVAFISGLFFSADTETKNWFAQYVRVGQKQTEEQGVIAEMRQELLRQLRNIPPSHMSDTISPKLVVQGCVFMRLYCALKAIANLKLNEDEVAALLNLVTCRPPPTAAGARFISLALCVLIGCPYIISSLDHERRAVEWIRWLVKEGAQFENVGVVNGSFAEMLLLIAIHFHGGQNQAIADLVNSMLGLKGVVKTGALTKLKMIFTQEIFTEQVVASHAVRVPVTRALSADCHGYMPVHCIYQLLKNRTFSKHKVPIKDWIYRQLCGCTTPLHHLVPQLIEVYIQSILLPAAKTDRTNEPITEQEIRSLFCSEVEGCEVEVRDRFTSQLLMAFYVLLYQDMMNTNMKQISSAGRKIHTYSAHILSEIPIKSLLQEAQKKQQLYGKLFSQLLRLLVSHYPHLCLVEDWLDEEDLDTLTCPSSLTTLPQLPCNPKNLQQGYDLVHTSPTQLLIHLQQMLVLPNPSLLAHMDSFITNMAKLLAHGIPRKLLNSAQKVWVKLHTLSPTKVRVLTVNALRDTGGTAFTSVLYTEDDITLDPLLVLRCDQRVFRCSQLMEITLRILEAFLQASRSFLNTRIQMSQASAEKTGVSVTEQEELKTALLAAQESAAAQILLEACLPTDSDKDGALSELREVQCLVCSHLHHMFIADPNLAKLIHFQGYPSELLAVTVPGIPSMHICLDFIAELISQPDTDKQMFAVNLVSHLSLQYSLPKSLAVARLALNVMSTLLGVLASDTRLQFYMSTVPALARIARSFPPLTDEIISLLVHVGQVCRSQLSGAAAGQLAADNPLRDLPTDGKLLPHKGQPPDAPLDKMSRYSHLLGVVYHTFNDIVGSTALLRHQLK